MGILGAATIAPAALIWPALRNPHVVLVAVAARNLSRAQTFAKKHSIPQAFGSYEELLSHPGIDCIYLPSPNGHHFKWAIKALKAGKHVLCEKPITSNAAEAVALEECAKACNKIVMEASHSFHHPALIRAREICRSGELGSIVSVEASMEFPLVPKSDIRFNCNESDSTLAGGSFMDAGVYVANCVRFLTDLKFATCTKATAVEAFPGVDASMQASVRFENSEILGRVSTSMAKGFPYLPHLSATVVGTKGKLVVWNFVAPFLVHSLTVTLSEGGSRTERVYGDKGESSYEFQLQAFVNVVRSGQSGGYAKFDNNSSLDDPINTMKFIDAVYIQSGLKERNGVSV